MTKKEAAKKLQDNGFNCSQRVFAVFCEDYGLRKETACKIACGFGAGMQCGEICGAVSGAVMVLGLKFGHADGMDFTSKQKTYELVRQFHASFQSRHGSLLCKELTGLDLTCKEDMETARQSNLFLTICPRFVDDSIEILEEILANADLE